MEDALMLDPVPTGRARPGPPPTRDQLERLAREIANGTYRVPSERVAEAVLAFMTGRRARRD